jgi:hypothetical protein
VINYSHERGLELLRIGTGIWDAQFRIGQEESIRSIVEQPGRYLVVQKTGWGKSFVYFIATKLLREATEFHIWTAGMPCEPVVTGDAARNWRARVHQAISVP